MMADEAKSRDLRERILISVLTLAVLAVTLYAAITGQPF